MAGRLTGKIAVVTGAGSGIGEAIVEAFIREGAKVVAADISGAQDKVAANLGECCVPVHADVADSGDVQAMLARAVTEFGGLNVVVNNAGIDGHVAPLGEYPDDEFDKVWSINGRGVYLGMRYGIPLLLEHGGGAIVNTASMASSVAFPGMSAYCASKGAVKMLTKTAAAEYAGKGIRVNAICPGPIRTGITDSLPPDLIAGVVAATPIGRYGTPAEVGDLAVFLASDESSFITGTAILIDGGYTTL
jgi:NAD(P)-dependent dehydrogenase (short-subunit alcohol dehydrogenase family)